MNASSIHNKTVRPGSLNGYSSYYYHSNRHGMQQVTAAPKSARKSGSKKWVVVVAAVLLVSFFGFKQLGNDSSATASLSKPSSSQSTAGKTPGATGAAAATTAAPVKEVNRCADNTLDKLIKIDISDRHLWACEGGKTVHDVAVITGKENYAATLTPRGEFKVYGKMVDTRLTGSDETGSWDRPVSYWMPFLDNEHGTYGFHDATWRPDAEFGNIDPVTGDASHGCVELPLASQAWLYDWAPVGTILRVES